MTTRQTNIRVLYRGIWVPSYLLDNKTRKKCGKPKLYTAHKRNTIKAK